MLNVVQPDTMRDEEKDRMELEKRFKRIDKNSEAKEKNYDENISDKHSLLAVITGALTALPHDED